MTPIYGETPDSAGVCQCVEPCLVCCNDSTTDASQNQIIPRMGTALRTFLRRYSDDLQPYALATGDRVATSMLECCDLLLIESDRLERGRLWARNP